MALTNLPRPRVALLIVLTVSASIADARPRSLNRCLMPDGSYAYQDKTCTAVSPGVKRIEVLEDRGYDRVEGGFNQFGSDRGSDVLDELQMLRRRDAGRVEPQP